MAPEDQCDSSSPGAGIVDTSDRAIMQKVDPHIFSSRQCKHGPPDKARLVHAK